jgi:hypothetical protein
MRAAFATALMTFVCAHAFAQQGGFAGGSLMITVQPAGPVAKGSVSFPTTAIGGASWGGQAEIGARVTKALSLSFEASVPVAFDDVQTNVRLSGSFEQTTTTTTSHSDRIFSGLVGYHFPSPHAADVSLVAGVSLVDEQNVSEGRITYQTVSILFAPPPPPATLPPRDLSRSTIGFAGGVDVALSRNPRLDFLIQIRIHWVDRETNVATAVGVLGLSPLVVRPAFGARVHF